jgi:AraC-like DNA-binding protein
MLLVKRVAAELARDFGGQMRLRDIANANGYNVYQLIRAFRRGVGTTPHAYMMRLRLDYAAIRLVEGDTIARAAAEAGFADQSHMTRHFKRVFGTTPGRFMRAARAKDRGLRDELCASATQQGVARNHPS